LRTAFPTVGEEDEQCRNWVKHLPLNAAILGVAKCYLSLLGWVTLSVARATIHFGTAPPKALYMGLEAMALNKKY
jgi:hypothetical protein